MLTIATSYPFLSILWTILIFMAFVIWYRIEAPIEQAKGLAHVLWLATRQIELAITLIRGFKAISMLTVEVHRLENAGDRIVWDAMASLLEVGIDPMVVIRCKHIASDRVRHAEPMVLAPGRPALSAEPSTTDIASDSNGGGSRFARNPGSHQVDMRGSFRKGGPRISSQRATSCRPPASRGLGKSFHPVGVMTRAARARSIADHPLRCRTKVPPC
jgi:hypothetical protein